MPAAVSTAFKSSIAIAGASIIAVTPIIPTQNVHVPTVNLPAIELSALPIPAFGAIPYQIGVNTIGNLLALTPILIGSTKQCAVCLGPDTPFPDPRYAPFTGWGLVGIGAGLITSPLAFVGALQAGDNVAEALGVALLAAQLPITNTFSLLAADRVPVGGFALQAVLDRAFQASKDSIDGLINVLAQALVTGPLDVIGGAVKGATTFAGTLAQTGDFVTAFNAGRAPFEASVKTALDDLTTEVGKNRAIVYADLTSGPGVATSPVPTVAATPVAARPAAAAAAAAAEDNGGPVTKVTDSVKAVPGTTASDATGSGRSAGAASDNQGSSASAPKASHGAGTSKAHRADSAA